MLKEIFHKLFDVTTIKFVIVGIINTLFGYGIGLICLNLLHLNFWVSTVANYFLGSVLSYFLNKHYTFRYKGGDAKVVTSSPTASQSRCADCCLRPTPPPCVTTSPWWSDSCSSPQRITSVRSSTSSDPSPAKKPTSKMQRPPKHGFGGLLIFI